MYEMSLYILNTTKPYCDNENDSYAGVWFVCAIEFEEIKKSSASKKRKILRLKSKGY
jgi:hypothetical protein